LEPEAIMPEEWLTVKDAAALAGYNEEYVRRLIRQGKVKARKFGPVWQVGRVSLLDFLRDAHKSDDVRRGPRRPRAS
jgi:excisionase family DNA binding protein